ncbi:MAG: CDC27 family protein [Verrucomicrobiae bacterium]|nr:CDC27 family protein [Verrucomicrobiae bacterium]NNJ44001.1 hypothetical protein [Akkermansiaceae bacterium]
MARLKRKLKKHWVYKKHVYQRVLVIVVPVVIAVWGALVMVQKEGQHDGVVAAMSGTLEEKYQRALELEDEGSVNEARVMMTRLARLGASADKPLGFGMAHFWVARDMLSGFDSGFLWSFPADVGGMARSMALGSSEDVLLAQRHLAHAVALNPEWEPGVVMLAASYAAQGRRNQAVDVLWDAVSHEKSALPRLHVPLANVLTMQGDDLALSERAQHLFSSHAMNVSSGRNRDVFVRIRYVLSALILKKYESAEVAIRRLEVQHRSSQPIKDVERRAYDAVRAVRMAYHYHRAVHQYQTAQSDPSGDYKKVVDELAKVTAVQPDCDAAIEALSIIASKDVSQKARIKRCLQTVLANESKGNAQLRSRVSMALGLMADQVDNTRRTYLEKAVNENPENGEAMLQLAKVLAADSEPDYVRIHQLAKDAMPHVRKEWHASCHYLLGLSQLRLKNWDEAIIALERSLDAFDDKVSVHRLLAEAYTLVGQPKIAAKHQERADLGQ